MREYLAAAVNLLRATLFSGVVTVIACWMYDWETIGAGMLAAVCAVPAGVVYLIVAVVRPDARILKHAGFVLSWALLLAFVVAGRSSPEGGDMASFIGKAVLIALLCMHVVLASGTAGHRPSSDNV